MIDPTQVAAPDPGGLEHQVREALLSNERAMGLIRAVRTSTLVLAATVLGSAIWFGAPSLVLIGAALSGMFLWSVSEGMNLTRDNLTLELLPAMVGSAQPEEASEEILLRLRQIGGVGTRMRPVEYVLLDTLADLLRPVLSQPRSAEASPTLELVFSTLPRRHACYLLEYLGTAGRRTWIVLPAEPDQRWSFSSAWLLPWWRELLWALSFIWIAASMRSNILLAGVFLFAALMPSFTLIVARTRTKREIREACQRLLATGRPQSREQRPLEA